MTRETKEEIKWVWIPYISIMLFVCLFGFLSSCTTIRYVTPKIPAIEKPLLEPVEFKDVKDGVFLDYENARKLDRNLIKMNGYIEQLIEAIRIFNDEDSKK